MFFSGNMIKEAMTLNLIDIDPFAAKRLQPASYDLTLGNDWAIPNPQIHEVYPFNTSDNARERNFIRRYQKEFKLSPGMGVLVTTAEKIVLSSRVLARIEGKSNLGRWGVAAHITAGFVDPGYEGYPTLEILNTGHWSVWLRSGMPICQIAFAFTEQGIGDDRDVVVYNGHFQGDSTVGLPY